MADTKEDIASMALARLGEPAISSFEEDTETAEKVNQLYEDTILSLFSEYNWQWATARVALSQDGALTPANEWGKAFLMPTIRTDRIGQPLEVFNSTGLRAPVFFDYEVEDKWILTNADVIVITYIKRKAESTWPGFFVKLAVEALAATLALPVTENASKEEWHTQKAYGAPSQNGQGGLYGMATRADARLMPTRSLVEDSDPMTAARFGGSRNDGTW